MNTLFKLLALIYMMLCSLNNYAQKQDNVWMMGGRSQTNINFAGIVIDFNTSPPDIYHEFREMNFSQANASICDTAGNLLFYTNGIYIANALGEPMENGSGLAVGPEGVINQGAYGYILTQGVLILPLPEHDSLYYLLHADKAFTATQDAFQSSMMYYSVVNLKRAEGLGSVVDKNQVFINDFLDMGRLTASKHANGRDWWLLLRKYGTNQYYRVLLKPNGLRAEGIQAVGSPIPSNAIGQSVFSPDGRRYASVHIAGVAGDPIYVSIYDFDRCSGELSDPVQFTYADTAWCGGVAISPSNRFLYVSSFRYVYQYDLEAADIEASKVTVAEWDGFHDTLLFSPGRATTFYLSQLAPDGKIYINSNNTVSYLHVINEPDSLGLACEVCQHCMDLPSINAFSMPNFPNYRLGHLEGSPCDTLRAPPVAAWGYEPGGLSVAFEDESYHDIRSWHWDFGDGATDSLPAPVHEYAATGTYEVCLTVSNPRGSDTRCQVVEVVPSSSREAVAGRRLWVGPNPAKDELSIVWRGAAEQQGQILVYDIYGRQAKAIQIEPGMTEATVNVSGLLDGIYLFRTQLDGLEMVNRVVVKH